MCRARRTYVVSTSRLPRPACRCGHAPSNGNRYIHLALPRKSGTGGLEQEREAGRVEGYTPTSSADRGGSHRTPTTTLENRRFRLIQARSSSPAAHTHRTPAIPSRPLEHSILRRGGYGLIAHQLVGDSMKFVRAARRYHTVNIQLAAHPDAPQPHTRPRRSPYQNPDLRAH